MTNAKSIFQAADDTHVQKLGRQEPWGEGPAYEDSLCVGSEGGGGGPGGSSMF